MKSLLKLVIILVCGVAILSFAIRSGAEGQGTSGYTVSCEEGEYKLYSTASGITEPIFKSDILSDLTDYVTAAGDNAEIHFFSVSTDKNLTLSKGNITVSGALTFTDGATLRNNGATLTLSSAVLSFDSGALKIDSGGVYMLSGLLQSAGRAIVLDYSAGAYFELVGGSITANSYDSAVSLSQGTVKIRGGTVENSLGFAISNSSSLIMTSSPTLSGAEFDVYTTTPITLYDGTTSYNGGALIKYGGQFEKGSNTEVFRCSDSKEFNGITLFDANSISYELTYFEKEGIASVYLPFVVNFYDAGQMISTVNVLKGDIADKPQAPERLGYEFLGWSLSDDDGELYEFAAGVQSDIVLYSVYRLTPPSFTLSSLSFEYDSTIHFLILEEISHPFLDEGILGCEWYRNGESLSRYGDRIGVRNVADSGKYKCKLTFSVGIDVVTVYTPEVMIRIEKATIKRPIVPFATYNGDEIYPEIFDTAAYTVNRIPAKNVGVYPIAITLTDKENYKFEDSENTTISVDFEIKKASNYWREEITGQDIYEGEAPVLKATAAFGSVKYLFSNKMDGYYSAEVPSEKGIYYVKAVVDASDNYNELESSPISFSVLEEIILGVAVLSAPNKTEYIAFEHFDPTGLSLGVSYNSGRQMTVWGADISYSYQSADSFRFGDSGVLVSYNGASVMFRINVKKATYDISKIVFEDCEDIYDGSFKSVEYSGTLPVGLDGIPISASISGGGVNVGEYTSLLTFSSKSQNYYIPDPISARITVKPRLAEIIWENRVFTYDGTPKIPRAYFVDVFGRKKELAAIGARSFAGTYSAEVSYSDPNYYFTGMKADFTIAKASYDMSGVIWSSESFVFDGEEKRVVITSGLPSGVSVIGYADNKAVNSGEYIATVSFSYDNTNYNPPIYIGYKWQINKAVYPTDGFSFSDSAVIYDGEMHYPVQNGEMPCGIDGSLLEYKFSTAARDVGDGRVKVEIIFSTQSNNYKPPENMYAYVEILPIVINVVWSDFEFTYDGSAYAPSASSEITEIIVSGSATDAGEYTATASALDKNYSVSNNTAAFKINKAKNYWLSELRISNQYCSKSPNPTATPYKGEVVFSYYLDAECTRFADDFSTPGVYYVTASTDGDKNHHALNSNAVAFEMIKVIPQDLEVELNKTEYIAFDKISDSDLTAYSVNNDGSRTKIDFFELTVDYMSSEHFIATDKKVTVRWGDFAFECNVNVSKRKYDMSGAIWSNLSFVYDGEEKYPTLAGLPEGVSINEYLLISAVNAGEYTVNASFVYDTVNYEEPIVDSATLVIKKCEIPTPTVRDSVYNGTNQTPIYDESALYSPEFSGSAIRAGTYSVRFVISDFENYCFEGGEELVTVPFNIARRALRVRIADSELYYFESDPLLEFSVVGGTLVPGDVITPTFQIDGGSIYATFDDPDYDISVIPGRIIHLERFSPLVLSIFIGASAVIVIGIFIAVILLKFRRKIYYYYRAARLRSKLVLGGGARVPFLESAKISPPKHRPVTPYIDGECDIVSENSAINMEIDAEYADSAISNALAKNLIRRDREIFTKGWRRRTVNVDTLSRSFMAGERVDVNSLKEKELVPRDTAYVKILARGIIDKPLDVYANDFSLAAVKMIALAGGKAIKVKTARISDKTERKNNEST